jgi:peptidoglycan/xylan/chitin deacetylase (PgdA/CDA1 family)/GT2 family glycosyltransferase
LRVVRFSIVIPTHQRRDLIVRNVGTLSLQELDDFEVIVSVDGSSDGTAAALRALEVRFPLRVIEQAQRGAAVARNAGAAVAEGELLLFLDDDMAADPAMLTEHDRSHRDGAGLVIGDVPLDPDSATTTIAAVIGRWAERRRRRLLAAGPPVPVTDLISGQMSIARVDFERLGGFDVSFTRGGLVPGADLDFGYRARRSGLEIVFNPKAISLQSYAVDAADYTRRTRNGASSDQILASRYPEVAAQLERGRRFGSRRTKLVFGALAVAPPVFSWPLRVLAIRLFRTAPVGSRRHRLFFAVQTMERVRGAREARRTLRTGRAVVLAYHSISDLGGDPVMGDYGVPPDRFSAQLQMLARRRSHFLRLGELLDALQGRATLPRRSVLITFDDAYADVLGSAYPILARHGAPAVVFAVSDRLGATNDWSRAGGARLPLLDPEGLAALAANGIVIGSHGATHRPLTRLGLDELTDELRGSADRLSALGLTRPTVFAYPHGDWSPAVAGAVHEAGYEAAFTVEPGVVERGDNRYALPRIEVLAADTPRSLRIKLIAARLPYPVRRRLLARLPGPSRS